MKKNIYLIDNSTDGHHYVYQKCLNSIENTVIKNHEVNILGIRKNILNLFNVFKSRKTFLDCANDGVYNSTIHFLYIDDLYKCPFISFFVKRNSNKYIATLHWVPKNIINIILLKLFSSKMEYVIVHSLYMKSYLNSKGIHNIRCIDYPSFLENNSSYGGMLNEDDDKIVISCIGGTRYDKGIDILCKAFKYIDNKVKNNILFNIAGCESDIKFHFIEECASRYHIKVNLVNKYLTNEEYAQHIMVSDVILLPYRRMFTGNSGPMTDGIYKDKFILGPNHGTIACLINKYDLGCTFETENEIDLANKISQLPNINIKKNHRYKENITKERFLDEHIKLYSSIS